MVIAVSACLLGENVTYRGDSNRSEELIQLLSEYEIVKVCPEVMGGLMIPRKPSEIKSMKPLLVENKEGVDVTKEFYTGSLIAFEKIKEKGVRIAVLKANSPSCGNEYVYDGHFSHTLIEGHGVFVSFLKEAGIRVFNENQIEELSHYLREEENNGTYFKD